MYPYHSNYGFWFINDTFQRDYSRVIECCCCVFVAIGVGAYVVACAEILSWPARLLQNRFNWLYI